MSTVVQVDALLAALKPVLPLQNPLWAFVHNNILMNHEVLPFHEAVREAAALYRARGYETEAFYRGELERGRLHRAALEAVLRETLSGVTVERFLVDRALGDDVAPVTVLRHAALDPEYDRRLQDLVVPVIASWLDQGMAAWTNPYRDAGLWAFFAEGVAAAPGWIAGTITDDLRRRMQAHLAAKRSVNEVISAELAACAPAGQEEAWCREVLFSLKGWSGMVARLDAEPGVAPVEAPPPSLRDWLAVLLVCTHSLDVTMGLAQQPGPSPFTRHLGRLQRWQEAYERSFAVEFLTHVTSKLTPKAANADAAERAEVQVLACMDDREESMRRALEAAGVETIGTVGFFGLDMRFEGLGKGRPTRQCPPVVEPSRVIREHAVGADALDLQRTRRLGATQRASLALFYQSRSLFRGFVVSLALGLFSFLPLLFKLVWPAGVQALRTRLQRLAFPRARTRIGLDDDGGYTVDEQARIVEGILRAAGHTTFSPVVVVLGHGSTSTNNPFRQAYGCGACSGNPGSPNARAFAQMANTEGVRARLAYRGLVIPPTTTFFAAFHDTALSEVELLDTELLPPEAQAKLPGLELLFREACRLDAAERAKRFVQAPAGGADALVQHMRDRGHDLAQPRPEYGHNRVAACVVGRRELTADTFLDRRCFLVSYDPAQDPDGSVLAAAVLGSVPVAVNIGMDYYFSRVDPDGFGAGSKLPLNVSSLLGVITGSKSDLRIGLARQMVELHEPMRIITLLEATQAHVEQLVEGHARMKRMVHHGWMRLGRIDPQTRAVTMWTKAGWVPWREHFVEAGAAAVSRLPRAFDVSHDRVLEVAA